MFFDIIYTCIIHSCEVAITKMTKNTGGLNYEHFSTDRDIAVYCIRSLTELYYAPGNPGYEMALNHYTSMTQ